MNPDPNPEREAYESALYCEASVRLRGASIASSVRDHDSRDVLEVGLLVPPQVAVQYVLVLPLPTSGLPRPWSDPDGCDPVEWAERVVAWLQDQVDARFPSWAAYDADRGPFRQVYLGADGLLAAEGESERREP